MSKPVMITADSTCDLSPELLSRFDIKILPLTVLLGDESFLDGTHFTPADMYRRYREDGTLPKNAAPGLQQIQDFFYPFLPRAMRSSIWTSAPSFPAPSITPGS